MPSTIKLSQQLHQLIKACDRDDLTLHALVTQVPPRAQALVTLILSLPFLVPIALPGLSTALGLFICLNGYRISRRKGIWLPRFLLSKKISGRSFSKSFLLAKKLVLFLEKIASPRGRFLYKHPGLQVLNGILLAACGFFLALPLPPGTNFLPALGSAFFSLGILEEDGLFIVLGYVVFGLNLALFVLLPILGIEKFIS